MSIDVVREWQAQAHDAGLVITNLFPDDRKIADWIARDAVAVVNGFDDCRLLVVREAGFDRVFYASKSLEAAAAACRTYADGQGSECVLDVVGPQTVQTDALRRFGDNGFGVRKSLTRMQRRVSEQELKLASDVRPACENEAARIFAALHQYFDARSEQLPSIAEVGELCKSGASFVVEDRGEIVAFLLGELQGKKGLVRYWFTMPAGRGNGVGSAVMHAFFNHCQYKGATFQELWVLDDNENAVRRYLHYGFKFDRLKDTVFEKK